MEIKVKDTVKTRLGTVGLVVAIGTELGPDYVSVRFSPNGFCMQLHKDNLTVVENPHTYADSSTEFW